jgi:hypothetical protein
MSVGVGDEIHDVLRRLLPVRARKDLLQIAPPSPPDVFAAAAYLLQISGGYHHVQPDGDLHGHAGPRVLAVTAAMRENAKVVGQDWKDMPLTPFKAPDQVQALWSELLAKTNGMPVFFELTLDGPCPTWWSVALNLMMIADEACADEIGWMPATALRDAWLPIVEIVKREFEQQRGLLNTIAFDTNQDLVNVLPKARTPAVGCTLRSLSHHLALLPPRGVARAYWVSPYDQDLNEHDALNILIVPYPYHVPASSFRPASQPDAVHDSKWGWFELHQSWLDNLTEDEFSSFVLDLVRQAERDCATVHGVVLPELALDWQRYQRVVEVLSLHDKIEFVICGVSSGPDGRTGNFVAMTMFGRTPGNATTRVREKHHRWKLDDRQIGGYAISSALTPNANLVGKARHPQPLDRCLCLSQGFLPHDADLRRPGAH